MVWKIAEYLGLALFIVIIPREMGPERYGEFAVLSSLLGLFALASSLGGQVVFGRFIPEFRMHGKEGLTRLLFSQFLLLRCVLSVLAAVVFFSLLQQFLPDIHTSTRWMATALVSIAAISTTAYQLQFGLNRLRLFMSRDSSARLLLVLILLLAGGEFRLERIVLVMLAVEIVFLLLGFYWSRKYFVVDRRLWRLSGIYRYLKFGVQFFASNLLLWVIWRSGELIVVELSGQGTEAAAYYNIANAITLTLYVLFTELSVLVIPSLSAMHISGDHEKKIRWMANILKYTTLGAWIAVIVVKSIGEPAVRLLMGEEYLPVTDNLLILVLALIPMSIIRIALSSALVHERPRANLWVTASALFVFIASAFLLTPKFGAEGTSMAVVVGSVAGAVVAYRVFQLGEIFGMARYWALSTVGILALVLSHSGLLPEIIGGVLALLLLLTGTFLFGILHLDELRWITGGRKRIS